MPVVTRSKAWVGGRSLAGMWVRIPSGACEYCVVPVDTSAKVRSFVQGSFTESFECDLVQQ